MMNAFVEVDRKEQATVIGGGIVTRTQEKMVLNEHTIF